LKNTSCQSHCVDGAGAIGASRWTAGKDEDWDLPLRAVGQLGTAGGLPVTAKRLDHSKGHGKIQG